MKALSIRQPWASLIADGIKTIETRTWSTDFRGDLLIVSSASPVINNLPAGVALCIVELADCRPMTVADESAACCPVYPGAFSWLLKNVRKIEPFGVKGQLKIYEVNFKEGNSNA